MKRILITIAFTVFVHSIVRSQATKFSYVQFDFAVSVTGNQDRYNSYYGSESTSSNAFFSLTA